MNRETKTLLKACCMLSLFLLALTPNAAAQKLELVVRTGHSKQVTSVAYSPDGKILASGSGDKTIKLWDVASGQEILTLSGHKYTVNSVAFSPDGKRLASASDDHTVRLWDLEKGVTLWTFEGYKYGAKSVAFSPDGATLASSGDDTIKLFEVASGRNVRNIDLPAGVLSNFLQTLPVAFSPDGKSFALASPLKKAFVWDTAGEGAAKTLDSSGGSPPAASTDSSASASVAFSPNDGLLACGSYDNTIKVWDVNAGREVKTLGGGKATYISLAFSPGGELLAAGTKGNSVALWDTSTWTELKEIKVDDKRGDFSSVAFSPDGKMIAVGGSDIRMLEVATGNPLFPPGKNAHTFHQVLLSPDGKTVAGTSDDDQSIKLWNLTTGQVLFTLKGNYSLWPAMVFSPDGKTLAIGTPYLSTTYEIDLWDVATGRKSRTLRDTVSNTRSLAFSADGRLLVDGGGASVRIWDITTGQLIRTLEGSSSIASKPVMSSDARLVARVNTGKELYVWNVESGAVLRKIPIPAASGLGGIIRSIFEGPLALLTFSPDGKTLIGAYHAESKGACDVKLWSVENGSEIKTIKALTAVNGSVLFSPDGKTMAFSNDRGEIGLLDLENGVEAPSPAGLPQWCCQGLARRTPGGDVTATMDGNRIKLVNASTKKEVASLIALNEEDWAVVSPDGRFDVSASAKGLLHYSYGLENITLEQLEEAYYEPGLLAKLLGYSKDPLRPIVPLLDVKLHPEVVEQRVEPDSAKLTIKLKNRGGGIGEVRVLVNDKLAFKDARDKALRDNPYVPEATLTVDLSRTAFFRGRLCDDRGENCRVNKVTVVTSNTLRELGGRGNINSRGAEIVWAARGAGEFTLPTLYAIVGGVSDYGGAESTALDLRFAAKDAEDFAAALSVGARRLFCPREKPACIDKVQVKLLSTSGKDGAVMPTKENFRKAFEEVAQKARPEDILVVYFAGHGVTLGANTDTYMYLTQEARTASREDLVKVYKTTAITSEELTEWLTQTEWKPGRKGIAALKQVLILDTCAAGTAGEQLALTSKRELSSDQVRAIEFLKDRAGIHILMASTADQPSYEASQYGQGLLTYALLQGLRGAALDKGDFVNVQTLFRYAEQEVPHLAGNIGGVQKPVVKSPTGNTFLIGQMTDADRRLVPLSQVKPMMLRPRLGMGEENDDPLNLVAELRKRFDAESSYEVMRRSGKGDPLLTYVDDDSYPRALRVTGTYTLDGDTVRVKAFLRRDGKTVFVLQEIQSDRASVVEKLVAAVRAALAEVPPEANQ